MASIPAISYELAGSITNASTLRNLISSTPSTPLSALDTSQQSATTNKHLIFVDIPRLLDRFHFVMFAQSIVYSPRALLKESNS